MDTNKILSADILDLVFDDRNKEYGAYELRKTYHKRIKKSLLITATIAGLVFTGSVLASTLKPDNAGGPDILEVTLTEINPEVKEPEKMPEQKKPEPEPQVQTEKLTNIKIVEDEVADKDIPTQDDLVDAQISDIKQSGVKDDGVVEIKPLENGLGIIEQQKNVEPIIYSVVQIPARYDGNWEKFLTRNLRADVPVENGAPAGSYRILVQFVVDQSGNVSDIKALTTHGYGMEDEAIRVLKKATGWKAGIQDGREVKSYHKQPITFIVAEE